MDLFTDESTNRQAGTGSEGEDSNVGDGVDLFARTWESLDFGVVLERLSEECRTEMGRTRALVPDFKTTLEEVRKRGYSNHEKHAMVAVRLFLLLLSTLGTLSLSVSQII